MAAIVLREYRDHEHRAERVPVSEFHRRAPLPERLWGSLLTLDLKNSEALYAAGAGVGRAGDIVNHCVSHLATALVENGATILQTEGDQLRAFFAGERHRDPVAQAVAATAGLAQRLHAVATRLSAEFGIEKVEGIGFRAGLATGEIRPIWQDIGGQRAAGWIEAGSENPFVLSSRMMELEKALAPASSSATGRLILPEELAAAIAQSPRAVALPWEKRAEKTQGKHGKVYEIAVLGFGGAQQFGNVGQAIA
jgi:hypothetical protein